MPAAGTGRRSRRRSRPPGRATRPRARRLPRRRRVGRRRGCGRAEPPPSDVRRGAGRPPRRSRAAGRQHPQRRHRVVGQQPRPDQVPHRRARGRRHPRVAVEHPGHPVAEHAEEQAAAALERGQHRPVQRRQGQLARLGQQQRGGLGRARAPASRPRCRPCRPGPDHLARRGELVEQRRGVAGHPAGQHQRLERRGRHRRARQPLDRLEDRARVRPPPPARRRACPAAAAARPAG